jgi:DNA-binding CsgD family transcriptional regulator
MPAAADAVRARVERLCRGADDPMALYRHVVRALDPVVGIDRWCGLLLDPATVMNTGGYHDEGIPAAFLPRLVELEATGEDVNALPALARDRAGVATVHRRTRGRPERCARFREVLRPAGVGAELRVVLRDRRRPWGALVLFRDGAADFADADLRLVASVAPALAAAVRRTLLVSELTHRDAEDGPGMAVLRVDGGRAALELASRAARRLLDEVPDGRASGSDLPLVVDMLVSRLLGTRTAQRTRVRLRGGRWVAVRVDVLGAVGEEEVWPPSRLSLVIEAIEPHELAGVIADAYGLTDRERQVARLVVTGSSNPQVAAALCISVTTVQDHLKRVFAKLGVSSRQELTARMFFDQYLPRQMSGTPVGGDGWYIAAR